MTVLHGIRPDEETARKLDESDPLSSLRNQFSIPTGASGQPVMYFCGNSLGLPPAKANYYVQEVMDEWAARGVHGHQQGPAPWFPYHELFHETGARLVGARPGEVIMMNSLTVNLHLLLTTFYRPEGKRQKILMESPAFPSDIYCLQSHIAARGLNPAEVLVTCGPSSGADCLETTHVLQAIEQHGDELATIMMGGVNFLTGQVLDMAAITEAGHRVGAAVGFDLAHAAGNVIMSLHDWEVDFAAWCSYKYLNASPGAIAGAYIHETHATNRSLPRLAGWWGNEPDTRFRMHLEETFVPVDSADAWQLSNPPILAMAPLRASLELFDTTGMPALRERSLRLTGYLRAMLESRPGCRYKVITPEEDEQHGCQLSIVIEGDATDAFATIEAADVVADFRPPNVVRVAPTPMYNTFHDCWRFAMLMGDRFGSPSA
ncbi:MAG: kynureninase [Phycisphaerales bacterium]|nr:kynureninase [Phycisphaerales bacterium]